METPNSHKPFLKKERYDIRIKQTEILPEGGIEILERYGYWMEALLQGSIQPTTPEQERFIKVANDELDAESSFERVWWIYKERLKFEGKPKGFHPDYIAEQVNDTTYNHSGD